MVAQESLRLYPGSGNHSQLMFHISRGLYLERLCIRLGIKGPIDEGKFDVWGDELHTLDSKIFCNTRR